MSELFTEQCPAYIAAYCRLSHFVAEAAMMTPHEPMVLDAAGPAPNEGEADVGFSDDDMRLFHIRRAMTTRIFFSTFSIAFRFLAFSPILKITLTTMSFSATRHD